MYKHTLTHSNVAYTGAFALSLEPDANVRIGISQSVMLDRTGASVFYQVRTFSRNFKGQQALSVALSLMSLQVRQRNL